MFKPCGHNKFKFIYNYVFKYTYICISISLYIYIYIYIHLFSYDSLIKLGFICGFWTRFDFSPLQLLVLGKLLVRILGIFGFCNKLLECLVLIVGLLVGWLCIVGMDCW